MRNFLVLDNIKVTTELLLMSALLFAAVDTIYLLVLNRSIKPDLFTKIKWGLVFTSGLIWFGIWWSVLFYFWESVYRHVFPTWSQKWLPFAFGSLMAMASFVFWTIAKKINHFPVITFCLCGGTWGVCTHVWAISRGLMTKPPMLQGGSPLAAVFLAFFEYIFYWCIITSIAAVAGKFIPLFKQSLIRIS